MKSSYIEAIVSLVPSAQVSCIEETGEITWHVPNSAPVTLEAIEAERDRLGALKEQNMYGIRRAKEYPSIGDQLDALFHAGVFPAEMAAQIQAVKDQYPKG